jgi:hypothetical protein
MLEHLNEPYRNKIKFLIFWIRKKLILPALENMMKLLQNKVCTLKIDFWLNYVVVDYKFQVCKQALTDSRQKVKGEKLQTALEALFCEGFSVFEIVESSNGTLDAYLDRMMMKL